MSQRAMAIRARENPPSGTTSLPLMESASMVTSRKVTALPPRQTCRRVPGGMTTPGAGLESGARVDGVQLGAPRMAAQAMTDLRLQRGHREEAGIQALLNGTPVRYRDGVH
jgi:hypothetical protein